MEQNRHKIRAVDKINWSVKNDKDRSVFYSDNLEYTIKKALSKNLIQECEALKMIKQYETIMSELQGYKSEHFKIDTTSTAEYYLTYKRETFYHRDIKRLHSKLLELCLKEISISTMLTADEVLNKYQTFKELMEASISIKPRVKSDKK